MNTIVFIYQIRKTNLCKLCVSFNLSHLQYFTQSVQQLLWPVVFCSRSLRFLSRCWYHIVKLFAIVGEYDLASVSDIIYLFAKKNCRHIGKSIVYFNTVLCCISSIKFLVLQFFQLFFS